MYIKKINKEYQKIGESFLNLDCPCFKYKFGILYTLYSDRFNSIEVGFAENNKNLENKLLQSKSVLLDKKNGKEQELNLLINTLNELGIKLTDKLSYKYSDTLIKHLSTLNWPIGNSLYKKRKIKKEILLA